MEGTLHRKNGCGWTLWYRRMDYRSFRRVYAVHVTRNGDRCIMDCHRVRGVLANGDHFHSFLVRSKRQPRWLAAISDKFSSFDDTDKRGGHWVIVEADDDQAAIRHEDVREIAEEIMSDSGAVFCGVYFISNGVGAVKIGQTTTAIAIRLTQLQSASAYKLKVVAAVMTDKQKKLEAVLHKELRDRRLCGEWFRLTDEEAIAIAASHGGEAIRQNRGNGRLRISC